LHEPYQAGARAALGRNFAGGLDFFHTTVPAGRRITLPRDLDRRDLAAFVRPPWTGPVMQARTYRDIAASTGRSPLRAYFDSLLRGPQAIPRNARTTHQKVNYSQK